MSDGCGGMYTVLYQQLATVFGSFIRQRQPRLWFEKFNTECGEIINEMTQLNW